MSSQQLETVDGGPGRSAFGRLLELAATPGADLDHAARFVAQAQHWPEHYWQDVVGGGGIRRSSAGVVVSEAKALGHAPVWQAVNSIAGDIGQLPIRVVRLVAQGDRFRVLHERGHAVDRLINREPNARQAADVFRETMQSWALLHGNALAYIVRGARGEPVGLLPLRPSRVSRVDDPLGEFGEGYLVRYSPRRGEPFLLTAGELLHIRGLTSDGDWGISLLEIAADVLGIGVAARDHAAGTLKNGGRPSGVLKGISESLSEKARRQMRKEWERLHSGPSNSSRVALLYGDVAYEPITMSNADAELAALMRLDREQVASLFLLPPTMVGSNENANNRSNVAESLRDYFARTLSRWANRWAGEIYRKLLSPAERAAGELEVRVDAASLTAGSPDERANRAVKLVRGELMTPNEGRELLNLNPIEGGDELRNPAINVRGDGPDDGLGVGSDDDSDAGGRPPGGESADDPAS